MEPKLLLGNSANPNNDIKVNDPTVSRNHLQVIYLDDNRIMVEDLGSTNGTYINTKDRPIRRKEIGLEDEILVGNYKFSGAEILKELKKKIRGDKVQFYSEFAALENKFKERKKAIKKLNMKFHTRTYIARIAIIIVILLFYYLLIHHNLPNSIKEIGIVIIILSSGIAALLVEKIFSKDELVEKRNLINEEFENILVCPKCETYLGAKTYPYWKRKRKCNACGALWF